jgi:transcription initiation factor TFIIIB Brf1 subunit/transcription initiation factor TFIIB
MMATNSLDINSHSTDLLPAPKLSPKAEAVKACIGTLALRFEADGNLNLEVKARAEEICKSIDTILQIRRFRDDMELAAGCFYSAFRQLNKPESIADIVRISGCSKSKIRAVYQSITESEPFVAKNFSSIEILDSQIEMLKVDEKIRKSALILLQKAEHYPNIFANRSPYNVCAAAILKALDDAEKRTMTNRTRVSKGLHVLSQTLKDNLEMFERMESLEKDKIDVKFLRK